MINIEKTTEAINRALDFKRDSDIGYMLNDCDLIMAVQLADYNENVSFEDAEKFVELVKRRR